MMSIKKQRGHAALITAIMIPALWGLMTLATEGTRMLQDKARMDDALEAATLAVAAHNDPNEQDTDGEGGNDSSVAIGSGSNVNKQIAKAYLNQYMTDMSGIESINIDKKSCDQIDECKNRDEGEHRFFQYQVTATTKHDFWMENRALTDESEFELSSDGTARKYQSLAVDVVFVADFSGSMSTRWSSEDKYIDILEMISEVTDELEEYNAQNNVNDSDSTASFVGYDSAVLSLLTDSVGNYIEPVSYERTELCWKDMTTNIGSHNAVTTIDPEDIFDTNIPCEPLNDEDYCYLKSGKSATQCDTPSYDTAVANAKVYIEAQNDALDISMSDSELQSAAEDYVSEVTAEFKLFRKDIFFHEVQPTSDFDSFNEKIKPFDDSNNKRFYPEGYTSSYQGIIRGAQMANMGNNAKKLIIVLSDGEDCCGNEKTVTKNYVNAGLCTGITEYLDSQTTTVDGYEETVQSRLYVIGFGSSYNVNNNEGLLLCAGSDNVYAAKDNKDDIKERILELISEEIGHLK